MPRISNFRWKGKLVTEKQYNKRVKQSECGKKRKKIEDDRVECIADGCRIVDLKVMAQNMFCTFCKQVLSLANIEKEKKNGLGSTFAIRCRECLLVNFVPSGKKHIHDSKLLFDVNSKVALGSLHAGLGFTSVNNFLHTLNIPNMSSRTFKKHEREIGPVVELVAKESCLEAIEKERALTVAKLPELEKKLPQGFQEGYLIPNITQSHTSTSISLSTDSSAAITANMLNHSSSLPQDSLTAITPDMLNKSQSLNLHQLNTSDNVEGSQTETTQSSSTNDSFDDVVRLMVSYDMGYNTRSSGRDYDSLNGYAATIGSQTGLVLDFISTNRKCRRCDLGHSPTDHDCRLNYYGSAKAMESQAAVKLCVESEIFKQRNVEVGVFISDNDCSSIKAVTEASGRSIVQQSDKNHTSKGVKSLLYKTANSKDVSGLTKDAINYLHRCFRYAITQNSGQSEKLAFAIKNIPYHAYDKHDNCGPWCGFLNDPENYEHTTVFHQNFYNNQLFEELVKIFDALSKNAAKFSTLGSTQANESLNGIMSRKAPKAISYSLSESADFRFACAVGQKNTRHKYVENTLKKLEISPGSHLSKHVQRTTKAYNLRTVRSKTPAFKKKRQLLKKIRSQLRHSKSVSEKNTYESHVSLLTTSSDVSTNVNSDVTIHQLPKLSTDVDIDDELRAIVFFDLETAGLQQSSAVIQIAARYKNKSFEKYIKPSQSIPIAVSKVNGLTNEGRQLFLHGKQVVSHKLRVVLGEFLQFLANCCKPCILVAHNCAFDAPRLIRIINETHLGLEFSQVVEGFVDTLPLFRKKFPKAKCDLKTLTHKNFLVDSTKIHDAIYDVIMLQNITSIHFTSVELLTNIKQFDKMLAFPKIIKSLDPLQSCVSQEILKRMAYEGIEYNDLLNTFRLKEEKAIELLEKKDRDGKKIIRTKKILNNIIIHLRSVEKQ